MIFNSFYHIIMINIFCLSLAISPLLYKTKEVKDLLLWFCILHIIYLKLLQMRNPEKSACYSICHLWFIKNYIQCTQIISIYLDRLFFINSVLLFCISIFDWLLPYYEATVFVLSFITFWSVTNHPPQSMILTSISKKCCHFCKNIIKSHHHNIV